MKRTALMVGADYVLKNGAVGRFEGTSSGVLTLADGSTYEGMYGWLRFTVTKEDGSTRTVFKETGSEVEETLAAKEQREREQAEKAAREDAAQEEALAFCASLGLEVQAYARSWGQQRDYAKPHIRTLCEDADAYQIDRLSIGDLRRAVAAVRQLERV